MVCDACHQVWELESRNRRCGAIKLERTSQMSQTSTRASRSRFNEGEKTTSVWNIKGMDAVPRKVVDDFQAMGTSIVRSRCTLTIRFYLKRQQTPGSVRVKEAEEE